MSYWNRLNEVFKFTLQVGSTYGKLPSITVEDAQRPGVWGSGRIYVQTPSTRPETRSLLRKAHEQARTEQRLSLVCLPVWTQLEWWQSYVFSSDTVLVRFLSGAPVFGRRPRCIVLFGRYRLPLDSPRVAGWDWRNKRLR